MPSMHEQTAAAALSAKLTTSAIRQAQVTAAYADNGPIELLLREAMGDALRTQQRLELIASFTQSQA